MQAVVVFYPLGITRKRNALVVVPTYKSVEDAEEESPEWEASVPVMVLLQRNNSQEQENNYLTRCSVTKHKDNHVSQDFDLRGFKEASIQTTIFL